MYLWQDAWCLRVYYIITDRADNGFPVTGPVWSNLTATDSKFVILRNVSVSLLPILATPGFVTVVSADINAIPTVFYVSGSADTTIGYVAVQLAGPNYLKCLLGKGYGIDY